MSIEFSLRAHAASEPPHAIHSWRTPGLLTALGALTLAVGLMLGPGPGADTAEALENIEGFRTRYVVTNAVDLVAALVLVAGLLAIARVQAADHGGLLPILGGAASALGGLMLVLTLVLQSAVDPELAERYVEATGADRAMHLAVAEAVFDLDAVVFGVGFLLTMGGIALVALSALGSGTPRLNRWLLLTGAVLAVGASTTALLVPFGAPEEYAVVESILGLIVLVWLVVFGALLARSREA